MSKLDRFARVYGPLQRWSSRWVVIRVIRVLDSKRPLNENCQSLAFVNMPTEVNAKDSMLNDLMCARKDTWFSFEYFPPTTEEGVKNLYKRILRMKTLNPLFLDFTWRAGGSTSDLTLQLCDKVKNEFGAIANMHLTCTNMEKEKNDVALADCKKFGICNLVALRGDPPRGQDKWEATEGGFTLDLVNYVRANHGDYFSIAVAGYPEGHPDAIEEVEGGLAALTESEKRRARVAKNEGGVEVVTVCRDANFEKEMMYLKEKIAAGSQCVITPDVPRRRGVSRFCENLL